MVFWQPSTSLAASLAATVVASLTATIARLFFFRTPRRMYASMHAVETDVEKKVWLKNVFQK